MTANGKFSATFSKSIAGMKLTVNTQNIQAQRQEMLSSASSEEDQDLNLDGAFLNVKCLR